MGGLLNISPEQISEKPSSQIEWLIAGMTCHLLLSAHLPWTALKELNFI
jgi:hypothetical protein